MFQLPIAGLGCTSTTCSPAASDWIARDPARLGPSLKDFIGHPGYGTAELRQDLDRFVFLLGSNDGEPLFGPRPTVHFSRFGDG